MPRPDLHDALGDLDADLPRWLALARLCGEPVLELGCGRGRVLRALLGAGHDAMGLERDPAALDATAQAGLGAHVRAADVLTVRLERRFPLVIAPARVAEELAAELPLEQLAARLAALVAPGGWLALAVAEPPPSDQPAVSMGVVHRLGSARPFGPAEVLWEERLDRSAQLRHVRVWLRPIAGCPQPAASLRLRWWSRVAWHTALREAGMLPAEGPGPLPPDPSGLTLLVARAPHLEGHDGG